MKKATIDQMTRKIAEMLLLYGPGTMLGLAACMEYMEKQGGEDRFNIVTFGPFICVIPKDALDIKLDAALAINCLTATVFIDAAGMFRPARTARQAYADHEKRMVEERELFQESALATLTDKVVH